VKSEVTVSNGVKTHDGQYVAEEKWYFPVAVGADPI
jgi:hypothetical protein